MKNLLRTVNNYIFFYLLLNCTVGASQTYGVQLLGSAKMVIQQGTTLIVTNNLGFKVDGSGSTITNSGTLVVDGSFLNQNAAQVSGGDYKIGGSFINTATFQTSGTVEFNSNNACTISSTSALNNLSINKGATNPIVNLGSNISINGILAFLANNTFVQLNTYSLSVNNQAISGFDNNNFIITNSTGALVQNVGTTTKVFPIGTSTSSYTPLSVAQTLTSNYFGTRVQDGVQAVVGSSSNLTAGVVNKSWVVTEIGTPVSKNLNITCQWNGTDELTGFDAAKCGISRWNSTSSAWDLTWNNVGARTGSNPYTRTRNGVTQVGTFSVGSKPIASYVQILPKVHLQGAYVSNGLMADDLRSASLIPNAENVAAASGQTPRPNGFTHVAWGGSETAVTGIFNTQANTNDNVVDWVFLELRDPSVSTSILHTRAALVQRDGDIVNEDGTSPLKIYGVPDGNYYVSVRHRNHLGVMTANPVQISRNQVVAIDFTNPTTLTYGTNAQKTTSGVNMIWSGDANRNGIIKYNGSANDRNIILSAVGLTTPNNIITGYRAEDLNLDGLVKYNGSRNDRNVILQNVGLTTPNNIITERIPPN